MTCCTSLFGRHKAGPQFQKKRLVFIPIPKKGNAKECSNYCTIAFISHGAICFPKAPCSTLLIQSPEGVLEVDSKDFHWPVSTKGWAAFTWGRFKTVHLSGSVPYLHLCLQKGIVCSGPLGRNPTESWARHFPFRSQKEGFILAT